MKRIRNSKGLTLIEVMIAMALVVALGYFLTSVLRTGMSGQKAILSQDDARSLTDNIALLLSQSLACKNTFKNKNPSKIGGDDIQEVRNSIPPNGEVQYTVNPSNNIYGNRGIRLKRITIGGSDPSKPLEDPENTDSKTKIKKWEPSSTDPNRGTAFVRVEWEQTGSSDNQIGPKNLTRYFMVYVTGMDPVTKTITECKAKTNAPVEVDTAEPGGDNLDFMCAPRMAVVGFDKDRNPICQDPFATLPSGTTFIGPTSPPGPNTTPVNCIATSPSGKKVNNLPCNAVMPCTFSGGKWMQQDKKGKVTACSVGIMVNNWDVSHQKVTSITEDMVDNYDVVACLGPSNNVVTVCSDAEESWTGSKNPKKSPGLCFNKHGVWQAYGTASKKPIPCSSGFIVQ